MVIFDIYIKFPIIVKTQNHAAKLKYIVHWQTVSKSYSKSESWFKLLRCYFGQWRSILSNRKFKPRFILGLRNKSDEEPESAASGRWRICNWRVGSRMTPRDPVWPPDASGCHITCSCTLFRGGPSHATIRVFPSHTVHKNLQSPSFLIRLYKPCIYCYFLRAKIHIDFGEPISDITNMGFYSTICNITINCAHWNIFFFHYYYKELGNVCLLFHHSKTTGPILPNSQM